MGKAIIIATVFVSTVVAPSAKLVLMTLYLQASISCAISHRAAELRERGVRPTDSAF